MNRIKENGITNPDEELKEGFKKYYQMYINFFSQENFCPQGMEENVQKATTDQLVVNAFLKRQLNLKMRAEKTGSEILKREQEGIFELTEMYLNLRAVRYEYECDGRQESEIKAIAKEEEQMYEYIEKRHKNFAKKIEDFRKGFPIEEEKDENMECDSPEIVKNDDTEQTAYGQNDNFQKIGYNELNNQINGSGRKSPAQSKAQQKEENRKQVVDDIDKVD